jgi:hypothetical protein
MRHFTQLTASLVLLATQVHDPFAGMTASALATADTKEFVEVKLNTTTATPLTIATDKPDYEAEVLAPLRAAQAEAAAKAAAAKAKLKKSATKVAKTAVVRTKAAATPANMLALRLCEAGNIYTRNSGNGYYGAYQFNIGTWGNWGGYARADLAPAEVQDAKFLETYNRRGWSPWPSCARKLGLM